MNEKATLWIRQSECLRHGLYQYLGGYPARISANQLVSEASVVNDLDRRIRMKMSPEF
ncbi:hypothetical protein DYBT9275_00060 [Dyadobacter sp. CECT 9275]|uniref:Uncharacterized protein n=1 Tax=Dyadobacter helix TaxID=2822344 RepID=A0A916J6P5_9BACT|nr:hypothetical protein DYBT9275_00060 [Dyadobacter sp. CECT 9275]